MTSKPGNVKVSAIIPLFNKAPYVARALDSVLAQTYADLEVIVVDDGSTDGGGEIVAKYDDSRVTLVVQENAGECAARNRGVQESQAEWVAFLDADDVWLPEFLERTMKVVEANCNVAAVFTNMFTSGEKDALFLTKPHPGGVLADYFQFFVENEGRAMSSSSAVIRKRVLLEAGGFPDGVRHGGDIDTWMRLAWLGNMAYVPEVLAVYHTEAADRVMKDGADKVVNARLVTITSYERWEEEGRIPEAYRESSARMVQCLYLKYARALDNAGDTAGARSVLRSRCVPKVCGYARYWRAYARSLVPKPLLEWRRRVLGLCHKIRKRAVDPLRRKFPRGKGA